MENNILNALLPAANIHVFSKNDETLNAVNQIATDWRLARLNFENNKGAIDQAIEYYKEKKSPDLLILQSDAIDENFESKLGELSKFCSSDTSCIVIGNRNDIDVYRNLKELGISDYLVAPIDENSLLKAISQILLEKHGQQDSELIAVLGSKGGNGTSLIAQLLAEGLSVHGQHKVLLLDAAGAWGNFPLGLGFDANISSHEFIKAVNNQDEDSLKRMVLEPIKNLNVAATGSQKLLNGTVDADGFESALKKLRAQYPYIVVDLSGAPSEVKTASITDATKILLTTERSVSALRITKRLLDEMKELRGNSIDGIHIVSTKSGLSKENEVGVDDIAAALDKKPDWSMPYVPKLIADIEMNGKKITENDEGRKHALELFQKLYPEIDINLEEPKGILAILGLRTA